MQVYNVANWYWMQGASKIQHTMKRTLHYILKVSIGVAIMIALFWLPSTNAYNAPSDKAIEWMQKSIDNLFSPWYTSPIDYQQMQKGLTILNNGTDLRDVLTQCKPIDVFHYWNGEGFELWVLQSCPTDFWTVHKTLLIDYTNYTYTRTLGYID